MYRYLTGCLFLLATLLIGACATDNLRSKQKILDDTLQSYAATLRWGDITQGEAFVDPKLREQHPLSALDLARYKQVKISNYDEQPAIPINDSEVRQDVQIGLINVNTQIMRGIVDHQIWRYDAKAKRWWLITGLPDINRRD